MTGVAQYDTSRLSSNVSKMVGMLLGTGASYGEVQRALMSETGQLAARLGDAAGPVTQELGMRRIDSDISKRMSFLPIYQNLDEDQQESHTEDWQWLYAGTNFIAGIKTSDDASDLDAGAAYAVFRQEQKKPARGKTWISLGSHNKQKVMQLNRVRVSTQAFSKIRSTLRNKQGQLRAAFYRIAIIYVPSKAAKVPAWISKHFGVVEANGKSRLNESGLNGGPEAFIEFTITSPGVVTNPVLVEKFRRVIEATGPILQAKMRKISRGAKYVFETGGVYFPSINEE